MIEINEEEIREWAETQIKKQVESKLTLFMNIWDWNNYIRKTAEKVIREKITDDAVKNIPSDLDRDKIVKNISECIAGEIANNMR